MKKIGVLTLLITLLLTGCTSKESTTAKTVAERYNVGLMLSDMGLGDLSISDLAFDGLVRATEDFDIVFRYLDPQEVKNYEQGIEQLVKQKNDVIFVIGYMPQEALEKVAKKYPKQQFVIVDTVSDSPNISSITFDEEQGSYLAGALAATITQSNVIGFIGGEDVDVIHNFERGYIEGAKKVKPTINVLTQYANTYTDEAKGTAIAKEMITSKADVLFAAAGMTGTGVLREAARAKAYAIGVDSDQYFLAEKAVVTSMMKNIDVAVYEYIRKDIEAPRSQMGQHITMGIQDNGVGLAPIRVIDPIAPVEQAIEKIKRAM